MMKLPIRHKNSKVFVIAEIGNNHEGSVQQAIDLVGYAADTGADAVKFQTFKPKEYISKNDLSRFQRLEKFQLKIDQFQQIAKEAVRKKITFFSTPFDLDSAHALNNFQSIFKISSGDNNFLPLINQIASYKKPTFLSTGLCDMHHLKKIHNFWLKKASESNLAFLHCVSSYPVPIEQANINSIQSLKKTFPNLKIGYSDHTLGTKACILAVAAGAEIIEKHFTLDNKFSNFRDHALSSNPKEMKYLVESIRETEAILGDGIKKIEDCEKKSIIQTRRSIAASSDLKKGDKVQTKDLSWIRPGGGIRPGNEDLLIGKTLERDLNEGEFFKEEFVE